MREAFDSYLTAAEVRRRINVSRETLRRRITTGELAAIKAGDGRTCPWMISESSLADYIKAHPWVRRA